MPRKKPPLDLNRAQRLEDAKAAYEDEHGPHTASHERLARKVGVHSRTIAGYFEGRAIDPYDIAGRMLDPDNPERLVLRRLAEALEANPDEIDPRPSVAPGLKDEVATLRAEVSQLADQNRRLRAHLLVRDAAIDERIAAIQNSIRDIRRRQDLQGPPQQ